MISRHTLTNGLRVIGVPQHETQAVTVMLFVPVGSRHETPQINGISHFLEHLMFKGTKQRPSTLDISKLLDGVGAEYNAYTSKDHTAYYIKVAADHLELTLDLFSDMLFNSLFDPQEIDRERGVIIEELNMYEDNPMMHVETLMEMSVFQKSHPLGYDIGGLKRNIKTIPRTAFMQFKRKHYAPGNMVLALAGKLPKNYKQLVNKYFGKYTATKPKSHYKKFTPYQKRVQLLHQYKDTKQAQISFGFTTVPYLHPDLPAVTVLSTILGGNMSSRLFISIREREGLCYVVQSSVSPFTDTGVFSIHAGLDTQRLEPAVKAIVHQLNLIKHEPVTDEELDNAKEYIKGQTALKLEDSAALASWYGKQATLTSSVISPTLKLRDIERVRKQDVQRVANTIFTAARTNIASIGPYRTTNNLRKLISLD